jgi:hypothetical protein
MGYEQKRGNGKRKSHLFILSVEKFLITFELSFGRGRKERLGG